MVFCALPSEQLLRRRLRPFCIGELLAARTAGSMDGLSPGTMDVATTQGRFIVRVFSHRRMVKDLRFEEALLRHLANENVQVPRMLAGEEGLSVALDGEGYVTVFEAIEGRQLGIFEVTPSHAWQVGRQLATLHEAGRNLRRRRRSRADPETMTRLLQGSVSVGLTAEQRDIFGPLASEVVTHHWTRKLPRAILHGAPSMEHVRFRFGEACGWVGFERASNGPMVFDLALALADWGFVRDALQADRAHALLHGYEGVRPLLDSERRALFKELRYALAILALERFLTFEVGVADHPSWDAEGPYRDFRHIYKRLQEVQTMTAATFVSELF